MHRHIFDNIKRKRVHLIFWNNYKAVKIKNN